MRAKPRIGARFYTHIWTQPIRSWRWLSGLTVKALVSMPSQDLALRGELEAVGRGHRGRSTTVAHAVAPLPRVTGQSGCHNCQPNADRRPWLSVTYCCTVRLDPPWGCSPPVGAPGS